MHEQKTGMSDFRTIISVFKLRPLFRALCVFLAAGNSLNLNHFTICMLQHVETASYRRAN